jgi:hypothetical protein
VIVISSLRDDSRYGKGGMWRASLFNIKVTIEEIPNDRVLRLTTPITQGCPGTSEPAAVLIK